MDVSQSHMSSSIPSSAPPPGLGHYASYHQPQSHPYGSSPSTYSQYYTNGLAPLHHASAGGLGSQMVPQSQLPLPSKLRAEVKSIRTVANTIYSTCEQRIASICAGSIL